MLSTQQHSGKEAPLRTSNVAERLGAMKYRQMIDGDRCM
jgi:hypothetical protein